MTLGAIVDALALPADARVDRRVPKKLLLEQGSLKAADKRQVQEGVEELRWGAALKPGTIGVPAYRDDHREYLEIAVLTLELRPAARSRRLVELVHRAIPYPVVLISSRGRELALSLARKRFSQSEAGAFVLDGEPLWTVLREDDAPASLEAADREEFQNLKLGSQPRIDLLTLYEGWCEWTEAFRASRITGRFTRAVTPEAAACRREALERHQRLEREVATLRAQAAVETQLNRRVERNLTIRRLQVELVEAAANL